MAQYQACERVPVRKVIAQLPVHFLQELERNQLIASCCRHPENHEIEALFSCEDDRDKGIPDIYILHCTCGRRHTRLCVGGAESPPMPFETADAYFQRLEKGKRPTWDIR